MANQRSAVGPRRLPDGSGPQRHWSAAVLSAVANRGGGRGVRRAGFLLVSSVSGDLKLQADSG
jgi:hypothetical protein